VPTEPTGRGHEVRELEPTRCPNGHNLKSPRTAMVEYEPRRPVLGWRCRMCDAVVGSE
jgi:hypothetical protein